MKFSRKHLKHSLVGLVTGLVLVALPLISVLTPQTAYANGEGYSWGDRATITVAGGNTRGDIPSGTAANKLNEQSGGGPGNEVFIGSLWYDQNGSGCLLTVRLKLITDNQGSVTTIPPSGGVSIGSGAPECSAGTYSSFNTGNFNIGGTRPGSGTETDAQKDVLIIINSPNDFGTSEPSINITLHKDSATGPVVSGPTNTPKKDNGPQSSPDEPVASHSAVYVADYKLDPGNYTVCADKVLGNCQSFTKVLGQSLTIPYGSTPVQSIIITNVKFNATFDMGINDPDLNFGPYTIQLQDPSGNDLNNDAQTNQFTEKTADAFKNVPTGQGLDTATVKASVGVAAYTKGVTPGTYKMCLADIPGRCVNATKIAGQQTTVTLQLSDADGKTLADLAKRQSGQQKPTCETTDDNNAWLICPIFNGLSNFTNWMFNNLLQPFLYTAPISTSASDDSFKIWSTFRVYGDIFLVIALLVIVFGESIGGGFIDAYTAKKALPRVLAAAILINLSVYIVAFLVDATNIAGATIGHIITGPIDLTFQPSATVGDASIAGGILGLIFGAGGLAVVLIGIFATHGALLTSALYVAFFAMLPIFLAIVTIFVVLVIRKGIILALILISPVAFALYCLPSTEQYFRKWWDTLFKSLIIYPAIVVIYAVADVLSVSIMKANGSTANSIKNGSVFSGMHGQATPHIASVLNVHAGAFADTTNTVTSTSGVILGFLAALFIEAVLKFWGPVFVVQNLERATGALHGAISKGGAKFNGMFDHRRELGKKRLQGQMIQSRENAYRKFGNLSNSSNAGVRFLGRRLQNQVQGGGLRDVLGEHATYRAEQMKIAEAINSTGDDSQLRALTVNKRWALEHGVEGTDWRRNKTTNGREFRTGAGNKWVGEGDVDAAQTRWGGNQSMMQWAVGHEMDKAATQEDNQYLRNSFGHLNYGTGMTDGEMTGMWTGAAFAKQGANRTEKHYKWNGNTGQLEFDRLSAARELDEKKSSYELGQTSAELWTHMSQGVKEASERHATLTADKQIRQLNPAEEGQLQQDEEFLGRASRLAGRMKASGAMYGSVDSSGTPQTPPIPLPGATVTSTVTGTLTPAQQAAQQAAAAARAEASIGAAAIARNGEEQVRFVRMAEQYAPEYTGPAGAPAPGTPSTYTGNAYGTQSGTENAVDKLVRPGSGPGSGRP